MPLTVPQGRSPDTGSMPLVPSESDLWMALAIMHGKGRFDQTKAGEIEDRRFVEQPELSRLRTSMASMGLKVGGPMEDLSGSQMAKDAGIEDIGKTQVSNLPLPKARPRTRASIGVVGGSR